MKKGLLSILLTICLTFTAAPVPLSAAESTASDNAAVSAEALPPEDPEGSSLSDEETVKPQESQEDSTDSEKAESAALDGTGAGSGSGKGSETQKPVITEDASETQEPATAEESSEAQETDDTEADVPAQAKPGSVSLFSAGQAAKAAANGSAETGVSSINTYDELKNLFANGGTGKLTDNITLSWPLTVEKNVTIYMNNKKISGRYFQLSGFSGTSLTILGTGTIESSVNIPRAWSLNASNSVTFTGTVASDGTIDGGTYNGSVIFYDSGNIGTIKSGIFNGRVESKTITDGTYNSNTGDVVRCTISGGTFNGTVNESTINGGTFNGSVYNSSITDGTFYGTVRYCNTDNASKVTVIFETISPTTIISEQQILKGQSAEVPANPSKDSTSPQYVYSFVGWWEYGGSDNQITDFSSITENKTYYAKFSRGYRTYTINWNANGGTVNTSGATSGNVRYGEDITAPKNEPTRAGYAFTGWYDAKTGGNKITSFGKVTGDKTFYAHWGCSITYHLYDNTTDTGTYEVGTGLTLPVPTCEGYQFDGWYDNDKFNGDPVTAISATDTGDKTFYAKWTVNTYTVTFAANGGKGTMANQTFNYDEAQQLRENTFTRSGYNFAGWIENTARERSFGDKESVSNLTTEQNGVVPLMARWTPVVVDNKLDAVNGTVGNTGEGIDNLTDGNLTTKWCVNGASSSVVIDAGSLNGGNPVILKEYALTTGNDNETQPGRNPKDWTISGSNSQDGPWTTITKVTDDATLPDKNHETYTFSVSGNTAPYRYYRLEITSTKGANVMQLSELQFTQYSTDYYMVTFDANFDGDNGQGDVPSAIKAEKNSKITIPSANLTRNGYNFAGWNTKKDGTGTTYEVETEATPAAGEETAVTLYALWTPKTGYTVKFANTGDTAIATKTNVKWTDEVLEGTSNPSKTGYVFQGWKRDNDEGDNIESGRTYGRIVGLDTEMEITIWGKFKANRYTIEFDANGGIGDAPEGISTSYDTDVTMPDGDSLTKANYTFAGWNTEKDGTGTDYTAGDSYRNLTAEPSGTVKLYADWSQNVHTIAYSYTGSVPKGAEAPTQADGPAGGHVKLADALSVAGYTFSGWSTDDTAVSIGTDGTFTMPDNDVTFTGSWTPDTYTISYDLAGGSLKDGESNPSTYTIESVDITLENPEKTGYTFVGWIEVTAGGETAATPAESLQIRKGSTGDKSYKAVWKDVTAPAGTIQLGKNHTFSSLQSDLHFDLHFKSVSASVTASDNSGGSVTIDYLTSDKEIASEDLEQKKFKSYSGSLLFDQEGNHVLYVRLTDSSGNISYLNTDGFVIEEALPSVKDIENISSEEKTEEYIGTQVFAIDETDTIESVTVDGSPADYESGELILNPSDQDQVVVITDKAGNTTTITVAVHPVRMIEGMGQSVTVGSKEALRFRSNADFGEDGSNFDHVEVDEKTVDPKDYTAWTGSTYAQLTGEYVSSLSVGEHSIAIVSKNGIADTTFTVTEAKQSDDQKKGTESSGENPTDSGNISSETPTDSGTISSGTETDSGTTLSGTPADSGTTLSGTPADSGTTSSETQTGSKASSSGTQNSSKTTGSQSAAAVKTGDSTHVEIYVLLMAGVLAALLLFAIVDRRRRRQR